MQRPIAALLAALCVLTISSPASARHHRPAQAVVTCNHQGCSDRANYQYKDTYAAPKQPHHVRSYTVRGTVTITITRRNVRASNRPLDANANVTYLPHPSGCPRIAFCACGAAVEIFGYAKRALWPAVAWLRFPRSAPAPGTVAVRSHHVFVLREHVSGSIWMTADYNSGGHRSRLHAQSIAGYTIVRPLPDRSATVYN